MADASANLAQKPISDADGSSRCPSLQFIPAEYDFESSVLTY